MRSDERFESELIMLLNVHGKDTENETADYILASYLCHCLDTFKEAVSDRDTHEGRGPWPASRHPAHTVGERPRSGDSQLLQCMPAELRTKHDWRSPLMEPKRIEGHARDCAIDLDVNWHHCTCGRG